jgi:hypothetical protein
MVLAKCEGEMPRKIPSPPPARLPNSDIELRVGERVKLSELGRRRFTEDIERRGKVLALSATGTSYRVRWRNHKSAEFLHWSYLTRDDE